MLLGSIHIHGQHYLWLHNIYNIIAFKEIRITEILPKKIIIAEW